MCYPDAEEPYTRFLEALEQFKDDLHRILVNEQPHGEKFDLVKYSDHTSDIEITYVHHKTDTTVKATIGYMMTAEEYQKESVIIETDDYDIDVQIENLDSVASMRKHIHLCREVVHIDKMMMRLEYGDVNDNGVFLF